MPTAGSINDNCTAAKLIIGDNEYYGKNGHGLHKKVKEQFKVNAQTATHAEGHVFYQAKIANVSNPVATLIIDRPACKSCGFYGGVRSLARQMGITDLTIIEPNNNIINFNPQVKPKPNPFKR